MFQLKICLTYFSSYFLESRRNLLSFHTRIEGNIIKVIKVENYNHLQCQHGLYIFQRINYFPFVKTFPFSTYCEILKCAFEHSLSKCQTVTETPFISLAFLLIESTQLFIRQCRLHLPNTYLSFTPTRQISLGLLFISIDFTATLILKP